MVSLPDINDIPDFRVWNRLSFLKGTFSRAQTTEDIQENNETLNEADTEEPTKDDSPSLNGNITDDTLSEDASTKENPHFPNFTAEQMEASLEKAVHASMGSSPESFEDLLQRIMDITPSFRKTRSGLTHQSACAVTGITIGGLLCGPFGAFFGGIIGCFVGWSHVDSYSSLLRTMKNMSDEEKVDFFNTVQKALSSNTKTILHSYVGKQIENNRVVKITRGLSNSVPSMVSPVLHPIKTISSVVSSVVHPITTLTTITTYVYSTCSTAKQKVGAYY